MDEKPAVNQINSIARLLVAAYIGMLLAGPEPFGFMSFYLKKPTIPQDMVLPLLLILILALPWLIAGFIAGKRMGAFAGLIGFLLFDGYFLSQLLLRNVPAHNLLRAVLFLGVLLLIPTAFGWFGGWLESRWRAGRMLDGWRSWKAAGIVVLLLLTFTYTLGQSMALHNLHIKFTRDWPADSSKIKAYAAGAYVAVDGITGCKGCGFPDTYYMDPTGLAFLYKCNLD